MLAVLSRLLKRRTRAVRGDAFTAKANRDLVRLDVRALDPPLGARVVQSDALDHFALLVVEPAEKRARAEQASETSVRQCAECVG
jgi:hypothetical protein